MSDDLLNILGGNVSSEASDIVLGAPSCNSGGGICKTDAGDCLTNCTIDNITVKDFSCLEDGTLCKTDLVLCPSDTGLCGTNCSWNCNNDCVTDGVCNGDIIVCDNLNTCLNNCTSVGSEISTDAYLFQQFGKGTSGGPLCTTKSRAISLGLTVTGSFSDSQLLPKNVIGEPTASKMNIEIDVYLSSTSVVINKSIYSMSTTSYLTPSSYGTYMGARQYLSMVGNNNIFGLYTGSGYLTLETKCWGYFRTDNSLPGGVGDYTVGQGSSNIYIGKIAASSISSNRKLSFSLELRLRTGQTQSDMAVLVDSNNNMATVRATGIVLDVTPYGVNCSTQSSGSEATLTQNSYSLSNGTGTYKGILSIGLLRF